MIGAGGSCWLGYKFRHKSQFVFRKSECFWVFFESQHCGKREGKTQRARWGTQECFLKVLQECVWVRYVFRVTAGFCVCSVG